MDGHCIRIGTSGWHYKHWRGNFYDAKCPASGMLAHYIRHFDAVEINNSFYRLPKLEALRAWHDCTPRDFCFAVKASRFITHNKKLKDPQNALDRFFPPVVEGLGEKLGPILFQLPPGWKVNVQRLEEFLDALPRGLRTTFEFRHASWHTQAVYDALRRHRAAFCIYELAGFHSPLEVTADFAYVRLHGPGGKYQGSYSDEKVAEWAARIEGWARHLREIHVYFDNDQAGYAAENALRLKNAVFGMQSRIAS